MIISEAMLGTADLHIRSGCAYLRNFLGSSLYFYQCLKNVLSMHGGFLVWGLGFPDSAIPFLEFPVISLSPFHSQNRILEHKVWHKC